MTDPFSAPSTGWSTMAGRLVLRCRDGSRPRLLLAEDSNAARILTGALLNRMGCEVDMVEDGEEALNRVCANPYDLVLMDIEMPVMDGLAAARAIRKLSGAAARTPIMALSAFLADSAKSHTWRESFDLALPKPAGRAELHSAIQSVLDRSFAAAPFAIAAPAGPAGSGCALDEMALADLRVQVPADAWRSLVGCAVGELLATASDVEDLAAADNRSALKAAVHKLKGIARSMACRELAGQAGAVEEACMASDVPDLVPMAKTLRRTMLATTAALARHSGH